MAIVTQRKNQFTIKPKALSLLWLVFILLFGSTVFIPFMIATAGQAYPDLDTLLFFYSLCGFIWVSLVKEFGQQTTSVRLFDDSFVVKRVAQAPKRFGYDVIVGYNERADIDKNGRKFNVLTVYLTDDVFVVKSNEFADYELLKEQLSDYGQPLPYQKAINVAQRNRLRWLIGGLALLISANIAYGYLAHNQDGKQPAKLVNVNGLVKRVTLNNPKGIFKGLFVQLHNYPAFTFYVSRKSYETNIRHVKSAIEPNQPIALRIRESDFRKKIARTEPLTFGDKYDNYKQIMVFGVQQGTRVHLETPGPVQEPTHTNPLQRTILSSILLLLCWAGWVYVDRLKVLRPG
ncbi:hypothetical protein GCM10027341_47360 [Spirosoma knui]